MDIRKKLRELLTEGKHKKTHKNEYGCVMVNLDINKWDDLLNLIDNEDLYNPKDDPSYGKEKNPHVTILYGLHEDIPLEEIEEELSNISTPSLKFSDVSSFKNPQFDVLKFDVDSKDLNKLNKKFKEFPYTTDFPKYHPHCTIAYLKPKMADKYIKKIEEFLEIKMTPSHIVYSMVNGNKKKYKLV
jgi:2'-5' RNA ligase